MAPTPGRQTVQIYPLPAQIEPGDLAGGVAVVIDVLRASTTIIVALTNGATRVIPCGHVETARRLAAEDTTGHTLTGGERGGVKIEGFDLDNSPSSYSRERVAGKTIAFTTTNGTAALLRTDGAARVLIGAFVNRQAIVEAVHFDGRPVHLICAGTDGRLTTDDLLGAAAIAAGLARFDGVEMWDDSTNSYAKHWPEGISSKLLIDSLRRSSGGSQSCGAGFRSRHHSRRRGRFDIGRPRVFFDHTRDPDRRGQRATSSVSRPAWRGKRSACAMRLPSATLQRE
jgi:2-phosphosulfolactate phosphatase